MKSYQASTPRAAILAAATAMTAIIFALSVLPAKLTPGAHRDALAHASAAGPEAAAAPREGMPIVVYGFREQETAMQKVQMPHVVPPRKQQG
jgi:hypothetical protein